MASCVTYPPMSQSSFFFFSFFLSATDWLAHAKLITASLSSHLPSCVFRHLVQSKYRWQSHAFPPPSLPPILLRSEVPIARFLAYP